MELLLNVTIGGVLVGGIYALLAAGFNLAFGVMRVINFAHAEFAIIGGLAAFLLFDQFGAAPLASLPVIAVGSLALGLAVHRLVIEPVLLEDELTMVLVTFGLSMFLIGGITYFLGSDSRFIPASAGSVDIGPIAVPQARLVGFVTAVTVTALTAGFLRYTDTGKHARAVSQNRELALLSGVPVRRIEYVIFGLSVLLAGVAGALLISMFALNPVSGQRFLLRILAIAIVGGLGSFSGALVGALLLGVVEAVTVTYVSGAWGAAVFFLALLATLLIRPAGLFGVRDAAGR